MRLWLSAPAAMAAHAILAVAGHVAAAVPPLLARDHAPSASSVSGSQLGSSSDGYTLFPPHTHLHAPSSHASQSTSSSLDHQHQHQHQHQQHSHHHQSHQSLQDSHAHSLSGQEHTLSSSGSRSALSFRPSASPVSSSNPHSSFVTSSSSRSPVSSSSAYRTGSASELGTSHSISASNSSASHAASSSRPRPTSPSHAKKACEALPDILLAAKKGSVPVVQAFSHWFEAGSNPSLERLTHMYPHGWVPAGTDVKGILIGVGPDVDLTQDHGYGRNGQDPTVTYNGPLGGLPGFCRLGANIRTSNSTEVLTEVWLPMADEFAYTKKPRWDPPTWPVAAVNWSDYPTKSTPYEIDTARASSFLRPGWQTKYGNDTVYDQSDKATRFSYIKSPSGDDLTWSLSPGPHVGQDEGGRAMMLDMANGQSERRRSVPRSATSSSSTALSGSDVFGNGHSTAWNGRILFISNGGQRGWVPWADMKQLMSRHRFVVVGTNTGHFSKTGSALWMKGNTLAHKQNIAQDWVSRATHISSLLGRWAVEEFYGPDAGVRGGTSPSKSAHTKSTRVRSYYAGCSVGGRNGLASAQVNPGDFDGIFAGSPAVFFNRMNAGQLHLQSVFRESSAGKGYLTMERHWAALHDTVLKQCGNDHGLVVDPATCATKKLDLKQDLLCARFGAGPHSLFGHDEAQCLTPAQVDNLARMFQPAVVRSTKTGSNHTVYPAYLPGSERAPATAKGSEAKARSWYEYAVFNWDKQNQHWDPYTNLTWEEVEQGEVQNVGGTNADVENLSPFFADPNRKLIHTHGLADLTISPLGSRAYHEGVLAHSHHPKGDTGHSYRYFEVPGMLHCRDGDGPWHFGSPTQKDPGNRPLVWDTEHDVLLRLVAWAEQGGEQEPRYQVAAAYASLAGQTVGNAPAWSSNFGWGTRLTRKLCPYPARPVYRGGPQTGPWAHFSYTCE